LSGRQAFDPRATLFAHNEPGVWYDPSDLGTMFTDSAGTTPVTGVEQAVGLILDKSRGLAIGGELVTNGDFPVNTTGWTSVNTPTLTVGANGVTIQNNGATSGILYQALTCVAGRSYRATVNITYGGTGFARFEPSTVIPASVGGNIVNASASGQYSFVFNASATTMYIVVGNRNDNNASHTYDNISVREIAGTHAIQPSAASRPVLRNRYNLLTFSEQFDNAAWQKVGLGTGSAPVVTANAATAPDGTTTADQIVFNRGAGNAVGDQSYIVQTPTLISATYTQYIWLKAATGGDVGKQLALRNAGGSGYGVVTLTADWVRYTRTETGSSGNWEVNNRGTITADNTVTAFVWGADLRSANDTIYPYQRIEAATVYDSDASKFPLYLALDGSDDSLYTAANLDLSSTDKVTVFAGVTKLVDAQAIIAELTASSATNNGTFDLMGPDTAGVYFQFRSKGTVRVPAQALAATYIAPATAVLTGIGDIAAPLVEIRANGASVASDSASSQGTGNYSSAPLYIGRRNNASLPYNGRIQQLIVRGAQSSAAEIASTERWVAGKQGRAL